MQNLDWSKGVGFAFCQFRLPEHAQLAIDGMEGCKIGNMEVKMSWAKLSEEVGVRGAQANGRPDDAEDRVAKARNYASQVVQDLPGSLGGSNPTPKPLESDLPTTSSYAGINPSQYTNTGSTTTSTTSTHKTDAITALANAQKLGASLPGQSSHNPQPIQPNDTTLESQESGATLKSSNTASRAALMQKLAARAGLDLTSQSNVAPEVEVVDLDINATSSLLIHNCFNKDTETEENWHLEITEDMKEECERFGNVTQISVKHTLPGGMVSVVFGDVESAKKARGVFEGRWFGERQLRVEYV